MILNHLNLPDWYLLKTQSHRQRCGIKRWSQRRSPRQIKDRAGVKKNITLATKRNQDIHLLPGPSYSQGTYMLKIYFCEFIKKIFQFYGFSTFLQPENIIKKIILSGQILLPTPSVLAIILHLFTSSYSMRYQRQKGWKGLGRMADVQKIYRRQQLFLWVKVQR